MRIAIARRAARAVLACLLAAAPAAAQLPNASAAAHAMGGNFTALARGYEALAWNPANLVTPGRPLFSIGVGVVGGSLGLDPVDFTALNSFSGRVVDVQTGSEWVELARLSGGQHGRMDAGFTPLALSFGPLGVQFGVSSFLNATLSPDAWEAMLLGNAGGNDGEAKPLNLTGTSVRAGATSAAAISFALPLPFGIGGERMSLGLTGKYVIGNGLVLTESFGSTLGTGDTLDFEFPMIVPDSSYRGSLGNGVGADLGLAWSTGRWRLGVMAENVFNSFRWDTTGLESRSGVGFLTLDSTRTDFETSRPFSAAPAELRELAINQRFHPSLTLGLAFSPIKSLTLTADAKTSMGGDHAIVVGPRSRMGVGAEWRVLPFLPLRGGIASVTDGWQAGAGFGLRLLGYEFGASTSIRRRGMANESGFMVGLIGIGR